MFVYKTVRTAVAPLLSEPRIAAPLASQLTRGEVVTVLETQGEWLRVHGEDAYVGWTHNGYLTETTGDESSWRISINASVTTRDAALLVLPLGARIAHADTIHSGEWCEAHERDTLFPAQSHAIALSASLRFAHASYAWGGVTPWGCDCSGFVQRIFRLHGVSLPRDARQQVTCGISTGTDVADHHAPGDLLFFSDRDDARVTHVGVALESDRMVHSALKRGGVRVEQLDADDDYTARLRGQCVDVRRVV